MIPSGRRVVQPRASSFFSEHKVHTVLWVVTNQRWMVHRSQPSAAGGVAMPV